MHATLRNRQRGQSMTEFAIVALFVIIPLFFGVIYLGKFSDMKHSTVQASRFAAFERAMRPGDTNNAALQEKIRARFFVDPSQLNGGRVTATDKSNGLATDRTAPANWKQATGKPLLANYADVRLDMKRRTDLSGNPVDSAGNFFYKNLPDAQQQQATVSAGIAPVTHFGPLAQLRLTAQARTVVGYGAWNAGGANDVKNQYKGSKTPIIVGGSSLSWTTSAFDGLFDQLTDTPGPQWGCVSPDAVPKEHLKEYSATTFGNGKACRN